MQTILIVEDDKTIAESITFILEQDSFNCKWFDNGQGALDYINNHEVNLILLDVGLPDMSGFDVLRKVREKHSLPVIIISARDDESDQVLGLEGLGANAYVTKPLSPRLVVAHVRAQLRTGQSNTRADASKFSINHAMQRVVFNETELTHLIKNPNRVHSREFLMSIIWDRPHGSDIKTINTHIKSIRKRLHEIDENSECIETHRGIGYSLIE
jgi:two-component system catabolic regulation response regulator CreB